MIFIKEHFMAQKHDFSLSIFAAKKALGDVLRTRENFVSEDEKLGKAKYKIKYKPSGRKLIMQ